MTWTDAARATAITLLVMIANTLLFLFNRWLFNTYRIDEAGYDYGLVAVAVLPAALAGLGLILAGFRSRLWWWLFAPGVVIWAIRPYKGRTGWEPDWVFDELLDYATWVLFHYDRTPDYAFAALNGTVVIFTVTAIITGQTIRFVRKVLRRQLRDGGLGGPGGGAASGRGGTAQLPWDRWASRSEVRARFSHPGGIVLGEMTDPLRETPNFRPGAKQRFWHKQGRGDLITLNPKEGNGHVLVMSRAGDFKTTGIVTSNILHYRGPLIVFDPKCELYARTRQARTDMGFNPVVIDASHGFDPARLIALLAEDHPSAWLRMARLMIPEDYASGVSNGKYFKDAATALFSALLAHYARIGSRNIIGNIAGVLSLPPDQVHDTIDAMMTGDADDFVVNRLRDVKDMESRFWYSIKTEITNNLAFAEYPDIERYWTMDPDSPILPQLVDPETDIFLNIPQHVAEDFAPMLRLMLGSILVATQLVEVNEAPRTRRLIVIDEASRLGAMDILENIRDRGRSIGLHLMMIYQDAGQIEKIWGQAGQRSWRNGCSAVIGGPVADPKSAQDLSTMLGSRMVRVATEGSSSQTPVMSGALGGSTSSSETEQVRDIPLISPTLISQLPGHAAIIAAPGTKPILATKAIWFTRDDMRERVKGTREIMEELDVFESQKKLIKRLDAIAKKKDGEAGEADEADDAENAPDPNPDREAGTAEHTAQNGTEPSQAQQEFEPARYLDPDTQEDAPAPSEQGGQPVQMPSRSEPAASQPEPEASTGETQTAQMPLAFEGSPDAAISTGPRSGAGPEDQPPSAGAKAAETKPETRNGITCCWGEIRRIVPDPGLCRDFAGWVNRQRDADLLSLDPSEQPIPDDTAAPGEDGDLRPEPDRKTGAETQESSADTDASEPDDLDTDETDAQARPSQASQEPGPEPGGQSAATQNQAGGHGGEDGDEAGTKENGQDQQAQVVDAPEISQKPQTAHPRPAAPQDVAHPDPAVSQGPDREDPVSPPRRPVEDVLWREPPAFWGELGVPWEQLDFGRKPPLDPARLPRWLRPPWTATLPLRRLWVRVMLPPGDIPLNMMPYTMEIIPRPHDATEGSWLLRKWDILDWYLSHPGDRYIVYYLKLRRRRESILRWRLRAWLWGRAPGRPPWLDDPYP